MTTYPKVLGLTLDPKLTYSTHIYYITVHTHKPLQTYMRFIHTSIVSRHLATTGNNKILCTPSPHISSSEEILPASLVTPLPNSEEINLFLKTYLHKVDAKTHPSTQYPSITSTHTTHIISSTAPTYAPHCHLWSCRQTLLE